MSTPVVTETQVKKAQQEWNTFTKGLTIGAVAVALIVAFVVTLLAY